MKLEYILLSGGDPKIMTQKELEAINFANWYEKDKLIYLRLNEAPYIIGWGKIEKFYSFELRRVDRVLYRWNDIDGFYHA